MEAYASSTSKPPKAQTTLIPYSLDHYTGATNAGFIRGGYHFAHGDESASDQADFFVDKGGGWTADGITLPGKSTQCSLGSIANGNVQACLTLKAIADPLSG